MWTHFEPNCVENLGLSCIHAKYTLQFVFHRSFSESQLFQQKVEKRQFDVFLGGFTNYLVICTSRIFAVWKVNWSIFLHLERQSTKNWGKAKYSSSVPTHVLFFQLFGVFQAKLVWAKSRLKRFCKSVIPRRTVGNLRLCGHVLNQVLFRTQVWVAYMQNKHFNLSSMWARVNAIFFRKKVENM